MKIDIVPIGELKPAEYNPRQISEADFEQLKQSITKFGLVDPIIVNNNPDRNNVVIGGHMRLRAAQDLGITEVPVHYVALDLEKEKELNIRLNKNTGSFDYDLLSNNFDAGWLLAIGFTEMELGMGDPLMPDDLQQPPPVVNGMRIVVDVPNEIFKDFQPKIMELCNEYGLTPDIS